MVSVHGRSGIFTGRAHGTPDRLCAEVISVMFGKNRRKSCLAGLPFLYDRKFLHSEETILKMPAFMRAPKQDDY